MTGKTALLFLAIVFLAAGTAAAHERRYGEKLCGNPDFYCRVVKSGQSWQSLWPDEKERKTVMKLNRMNVKLGKGMVIAVPEKLTGNFMAYSPFPGQIQAPKEKVLIWDPKLLAFAAYDAKGFLVRWGPAVGGADWCEDLKKPCRTAVGTFRVIFTSNADYKSNVYPLKICKGDLPGRPGCMPLPWFFLFAYEGYGWHGSDFIDGRNVSHGCVRVSIEDAEWLDRNFVKRGTRIIIRPY